MKIVCLGDSITWGFPHGTQDSWVEMLSQALNVTIINKGINGDTTSGMLRRFTRAVLQQNPTHLILMGGINDVVQEESYDRITRNIMDMVEMAKDAGIKVILGTPTAVDFQPWERLLVRLRKWIFQYANEQGIAVIDFSQAFYDQSGQLKTDLLLPDGGHPTRKGYQAMFEQINLSIFEN
ncbi:MAG: SGNH/GDSL hydrolase family protein [Syntrophomonadaceae bacterium]|nr:SGNH/GDSL hydrolase family protein [Syntrophomonadaceae bacterium]